MRTPHCSCLSQTLAKIHLNLVSNIKTTCGVLGLSFKALNWYSTLNVMYWMCIQLCCHGQSWAYSAKELSIRICSQITKKYIDWHENPALHCYLTLDSLMITFDPNQCEACNSFKILYPASKLKVLSFSPLSFCHSPGSAIVRAPPQLEFDMGSSPEAWHLASDLQHPRTPHWCCSVLPSAQQCRHRPTRYQHLQSLSRFLLPHRGLFFISYCSFSVFISGRWSIEGTRVPAHHSPHDEESQRPLVNKTLKQLLYDVYFFNEHGEYYVVSEYNIICNKNID